MTSYLLIFENYLQNEEGLSPQTIRKYSLDVRIFLKWLAKDGEVSEIDLQKIHVTEFRAFFAEKSFKPARHHRVLASLRKFWRFMTEVQNTNLDRGLFELKKPKISYRNPEYLEVAEVAQLLEVAYAQKNPQKALRDWAILAFLYGTGCRISEALNLTLTKIRYDRGLPVAVSVIGKADKERLIVLSSTAQRSLTQWLNVRKVQGHPTSPYVFSHLRGKKFGQPYSARMVELTMKTLGLQIGLPDAKCTPHKLRHAHATALLEAGRSIEEIKEILGHVSIATTQIYAHVNQQRLAHAMTALPDVLDVQL